MNRPCANANLSLAYSRYTTKTVRFLMLTTIKTFPHSSVNAKKKKEASPQKPFH